MVNYPARKAYQDKHSANEYDIRRFSSFRGKLLDRLEKRDVLRCLSTAFYGRSPASIHVLDVPCGTGRITETLLTAGYKASGSDISREMIEVARKRLSQYAGFKGLYREDIEKFSFSSSMFDAAICVRLMGHLPTEHKKVALEELARVSREYVIVVFYVSNWGHALKRKIKTKLFHKTAPWYPLTRSEIISLVNDCGLKIVTYHDVFKLYSEASTYLLRL